MLIQTCKKCIILDWYIYFCVPCLLHLAIDDMKDTQRKILFLKLQMRIHFGVRISPHTIPRFTLKENILVGLRHSTKILIWILYSFTVLLLQKKGRAFYLLALFLKKVVTFYSKLF